MRRLFFLLSFCFLEGIGVQKDNEKAIYYLHKAVKLGDVTSMLKLYEIYVAKKKFSKSIFFVENAAEKGLKGKAGSVIQKFVSDHSNGLIAKFVNFIKNTIHLLEES